LKRIRVLKSKRKLAFDPNTFLAKVGEGKTMLKCRKNQIVFSQGQVADAVFYIQQGKVKVTVVSEQGKEAVVAILGPGHFLVKDVSMAIRGASQQRGRSMNA
jgi:CRP-like cAMP-binding protein